MDMAYLGRTYRPPDEYCDYAIGADPAEGKRGKDYTAAYVQRCDTGRIVASLHGYIDEVELARQLWLAGYFYSTRTGFIDDEIMGRKPAKLGVEANRQTTITILQIGNPDEGIPKYEKDCIYRMPNPNDLALGKVTPGDKYGWYTSNASRPHLVTSARLSLSDACSAIDNGGDIGIVDSSWVYEGMHFILDQTGKFQAASGFYDDRIIAKAICDKVTEQVRGRQRRWKPKEERQEIKDMWYYEDDDAFKNGDAPIFNLAEAKRKAGQAERQKELWY